MELALTTLLLLPGVISLAIATGPRHRAIAPRDLPAAIVAILGFALANFAIAAITYKLTFRAPTLGPTITAILTGNPCGDITREAALARLFAGHWRHVGGFLYLIAASVVTGRAGAAVYERVLRIIARRNSSHFLEDNRWWIGKGFDWFLVAIGMEHVAIARGASYWLIVEQTAKLLAYKEPEIYADIVQGEGPHSKLFAGQVKQVISSRSGETISIVLNKAQRYRRAETGPTADNGSLLKRDPWNRIGDSEAFYMRGETVQNISYRIYGGPAKGGYRRIFYEGRELTATQDFIDALRRPK